MEPEEGGRRGGPGPSTVKARLLPQGWGRRGNGEKELQGGDLGPQRPNPSRGDPRATTLEEARRRLSDPAVLEGHTPTHLAHPGV